MANANGNTRAETRAAAAATAVHCLSLLSVHFITFLSLSLLCLLLFFLLFPLHHFFYGHWAPAARAALSSFFRDNVSRLGGCCCFCSCSFLGTKSQATVAISPPSSSAPLSWTLLSVCLLCAFVCVCVCGAQFVAQWLWKQRRRRRRQQLA